MVGLLFDFGVSVSIGVSSARWGVVGSCRGAAVCGIITGVVGVLGLPEQDSHCASLKVRCKINCA